MAMTAAKEQAEGTSFDLRAALKGTTGPLIGLILLCLF